MLKDIADEWQRSDLNSVKIQEGFGERSDLAVGAEGAKAWKRV